MPFFWRYLIALAIAQGVTFLLLAMSPRVNLPGGNAVPHTWSAYWK